MKKNSSAKVYRQASSGRFTVVKQSGKSSTHAASTLTSTVAKRVIAKNRSALKRLANS